MSEHRYSRKSVVTDYLRSGAGVLFTGAPLVAAPMTQAVSIVFACMFALFAIYGARNYARHRSVVVMDEHGLRLFGPFRRAIDWQAITALKVDYYGNRRDAGRTGWMQLVVKAPDGTLRIDSTLEGFDQIARQTTEAAVGAGVALSPRSAANLRALGIVAEARPPREA